MAEGHTVVRWANRLRSLIGRPLEVVEMPSRWHDRAWLLVGQEITRIETHGKHLLIHLSDGQMIHCHALMFGSWQVGNPDMKLRKPSKHVRLRLRTSWREAVFFHGPVVELLTEEERARHAKLKALGPDLLHDHFDRDEVWRRLQRDPAREIGDAILDQTIIAGIGNIYKSEGLFVAGIDPRRRVAEVERADVERVWDVAIPMMWEGARTYGPITTLPADLQKGRTRNWVYRRNKKPCFQCGATIEMIRQGPMQRTTYFCPHCQL